MKLIMEPQVKQRAIHPQKGPKNIEKRGEAAHFFGVLLRCDICLLFRLLERGDDFSATAHKPEVTTPKGTPVISILWAMFFTSLRISHDE